MRIAIYDGILETHVASSFERALVRRGHTVLNTGKIGHGFEFPGGGADVSHLEAAVGQVLAFQPDVVLVMRPASLPPKLITRFKKRGIPLAVWLSDDPVLFHLTYAPLLEEYDYVLHCGTERVLQHYEDFFGRPTGVNFPFWTDHEAFPYVWGDEQPESDVLFLGNVHDAVRRRRYFAIGQMAADVRVHGNTGADYLGLAGGYLDSDAEVVSAGAAARIALNIPQFFKDHRGLPTWFPGLDELGFFEYPSRVVQYIAMGLPVISIIPGTEKFDSLPEMLVVPDLAAADAAIADLLASDLASLSRAMEARFSRHYSAEARAIAFESFLADDSWRSLDARERNMWFTQFDGSAPTGTAPARESVAVASPPTQILVVGTAFDRPTSRAAVTLRALTNLGHQARPYDPERGGAVEGTAGIICCGAQLADKLPEAPGNPWAVLIHETAHQPRDVAVPLTRFDAIGVADASLAARLSAAGHRNVLFCPPAVDADFLKHCAAVTPSAIVQTHTSSAADHLFAPAFTADVTDPGMRQQTFESLRELNLPELAAALRSHVGLIGLRGNRTAPVIDEITPFAAVAADVVVLPRVAPSELIAPYGDIAVQVRERGELALKLRRLGNSATALAEFSEADKSVLHAEPTLRALMGQAAHRMQPTGRPGRYPTGLPYLRMGTRPIEADEPAGSTILRALELQVSVSSGDHSDHLLRIYHESEVILEVPARPQLTVVVQAGTGQRLGRIMTDLLYVGPVTTSPASELGVLTCTAGGLTSVPGAGARSSSTRAWILTG